MKGIVATSWSVVACMVLLGGAVGVFGNMELATSQIYPRVPRTEQDRQIAHVGAKDGEPAVMIDTLTVIARGRSRDGDPCIPAAPVTFSGREPVIC